jgi:carbamoyl-phosphate synthase large subunit
MRRVLRAGDTHKAYVVREPSIDDVVRRAALALQPFGACNFQLRMVDEAPMIFEINARCSGTTAARSLAGFNEPRMVADALLSGAAPTYDIKEMAILRYWNELAVPYERIDAIRSDLAVDGDGSQLWSPGLTDHHRPALS